MAKKNFSGNTRPDKIKPIKKRLIREEHGSQVVTFGRDFFPTDWSVISIGTISNNSVTITRVA